MNNGYVSTKAPPAFLISCLPTNSATAFALKIIWSFLSGVAHRCRSSFGFNGPYCRRQTFIRIFSFLFQRRDMVSVRSERRGGAALKNKTFYSPYNSLSPIPVLSSVIQKFYTWIYFLTSSKNSMVGKMSEKRFYSLPSGRSGERQWKNLETLSFLISPVTNKPAKKSGASEIKWKERTTYSINFLDSTLLFGSGLCIFSDPLRLGVSSLN